MLRFEFLVEEEPRRHHPCVGVYMWVVIKKGIAQREVWGLFFSHIGTK